MSYSIEKFVLHEHDAQTAGLHYDLRITIPNRDTLASFALPKHEVPRKPGDKLLAVRTNDHGRMWLNIDHMIIPKGDYGEGVVKTAQRGVCEIEGWSNNYITFHIKADDKDLLNGRYALIKFKGSKNGDRDNLWIFLKTRQQ